MDGLLSFADILKMAERETGAYGLADAGLVQRASGMVDWINERGPYRLEQVWNMRVQVQRLLANRLRLKLDRQRFPGIQEEAIENPIFVMGFPRSGTTLLHSLIAEDPEVQSLRNIVTPRNTNTYVTLVDRENRTRTQMELQQQMTRELRSIPGIRVQGGGGGNPGGGPVRINLTGDDSAILASAAANIERELRTVPGLSNVTTSASLLQPELVIRPNAERAAELGVTTQAISQATRIAT